MTLLKDGPGLLNRVLDRLAVGVVHLTATTLCGDTGLAFPDDFAATCVHHLREGEVWFDGPDIAPQRMQEGDLAWVLRAAGHRGRTSPDALAVPLSEADIAVGPGVSKRVSVGDGSIRAEVFTSHLMWQTPQLDPLFDLLPSVFVLSREEQDEGIRALLDLLAAERKLGARGSRVAASRLTELLWIHLVRRAAHHAVPEPGLIDGLSHPGLARALTAIDHDPARSWSLQGLARTAGMSRTQFARAFRERVGLTPFEYVRRWRVHRAQELLRDGSRGLEAVAAEVGYASSVSFSRSFSAVMGVPPGQWRRAVQT